MTIDGMDSPSRTSCYAGQADLDRAIVMDQTITHPDKPLWPDDGDGQPVTKLDLALYYARVGDWLFPELVRRPVTLLRCTTGVLKDCFYQRHAFKGLPDGIAAIDLADEEGRAAFIAVTA